MREGNHVQAFHNKRSGYSSLWFQDQRAEIQGDRVRHGIKRVNRSNIMKIYNQGENSIFSGNHNPRTSLGDNLVWVLLLPFLLFYWVGTLIGLITIKCNDYWRKVEELNNEYK